MDTWHTKAQAVWSAAAVVALAVAACGGEATSSGASDLGTSGTAGQSGAAGVSGNPSSDSGPDSGGSTPDSGCSTPDSGGSNTDLDAGGPSDVDLRTCYPEEKCPGSGMQSVEGMRFVDGQQVKCLLTALRDRIPGLYSFTTTFNAGYGMPFNTSTTLIAVLADGSALTGSPGAPPGTSSHCQLGSPAHFDECLATFGNPDAGVSAMPGELDPFWACTYYQFGWLQDCAEASPLRCP